MTRPIFMVEAARKENDEVEEKQSKLGRKKVFDAIEPVSFSLDQNEISYLNMFDNRSTAIRNLLHMYVDSQRYYTNKVAVINELFKYDK